MSEFKFACPVCGQHITADASASGGQLECPTCFQKIIVPQAPAVQDTKLIVSAAQVAKARPTSLDAAPQLDPLQASPRRTGFPALVALLVLLCAAGAALVLFRHQIFKPAPPEQPGVTNALAQAPADPVILNTNYPVPTNIQWTLNLTNEVLPETTVAGRIHGSGFFCERAILRSDFLSLSQGKTWPWDLGVNVNLLARQAEDLSGGSLEVTPDRPRAPHILLRWKDEHQQSATETITNGYALKLVFGQAANGRMPGKIYLCLPDEARSFIAGTFDAEIREVPPPKRSPKRPRKPKT